MEQSRSIWMASRLRLLWRIFNNLDLRSLVVIDRRLALLCNDFLRNLGVFLRARG